MKVTQEDVRSLASQPVADSDGAAFLNPSREFQEKFIGISFEDAYEQAARFLNYIAVRCDIEGAGRILDFGCGWGRMLKLLRTKLDLAGPELYGCDVMPEALDYIRMTTPNVYLAPSDPWPPTRYRPGQFGLIFAFSVFSHLREDAHKAWAKELAGLLGPGGHLVITLQGAAYMKMCEEYRTGAKPATHPWHSELAASPFGLPEARAKYEAGEFMYFPNSRDVLGPTYGEAVAPRQFIEREWGALGLEIIDWDETHGQNWATLKLV